VRPIICLVSPARDPDAGRDGWLARVRAAARAGVQLVHVRQPAWDGGPLLALTRATLDAVAGHPTRVIVNDRLDVALAAGAHGVHLRGDSCPALRVRAHAPRGFLIGRSVHSVAEAGDVASEGGLDYLVFGTTFSTSSKPGRAAAGTVALEVAASAVPLPILAIGGITLDRIPEVARSGAAGICAIGLFDDDGVGATVAEVQQLWGGA
jgi:thiamine-phosphate pyrophosphorylase